MTLYYLGPKGTFSYLAALKLMAQSQQDDDCLVEKDNLYEVMTSLQKETTATAIVPIENSIEGTINVIADTLTDYPLSLIHI